MTTDAQRSFDHQNYIGMAGKISENVGVYPSTLDKWQLYRAIFNYWSFSFLFFLY